MDLLKKTLYVKVLSVDEKNHTIDFVMSTSDDDRHGESVDQKGWKTDEFMLNPVVLFAHDQWQPSVGKVTKIGYGDSGNLEGTVKFAVEENPFAKILFDLYRNGFMRAVSVGFRNDKYEFNEETDKLVLLENTLYELSLVNVPANVRALAKQKGIKFDALEKKEKELTEKSSIVEVMKKVTKEVIEELKASDKKEVDKQNEIKQLENISANIAKIIKTKVETPKAKGGGLRTRDINKTVRKLLKKKQQIK